MKRVIYRGQAKEGFEEAAIKRLRRGKNALCLVREGYITTIAAYYWNRNIFLYYECVENVIEPHDIFHDVEAFLEDWPGEAKKRKWIPMIHVFHFDEAVNWEQWVKKEPVNMRAGRVAVLNPEMISSYIYYHYQLYEEKALFGGNFEAIALHENLLFGYQEVPVIKEVPDPYSQPWQEGHLYFKKAEQIFAYYMV